MTEYTPRGGDERIAHAYAGVIYHWSKGVVSREEGVADFYAYLAAHDARVLAAHDARAEKATAREALDGLADEATHVNWEMDGPSFALRVRRFKNRNYPEETP